MPWLLADLSRMLVGPDIDLYKNPELRKWCMEHLGRAVALGPTDMHTYFDLTSTPGVLSSLYYSLSFWLPKQEFLVKKVDEFVEVSPIHSGYYAMTIKQKEEIEAKIKAGIASAAQAVADYDLLKHDERKYLEFKGYIERGDEHSLKAVFIDLVDAHTGDIALRTIVQRWPTIITDFMAITDEDLDINKVKEKLKISKAEAVVLVTKNKLYQEWKRLFLPEVESRLKRIQELVLSREASIEQYREWVKPYVARHRLLRQAFEISEERKAAMTSFVHAGGHATSRAVVKLLAWREFMPPELPMAPGERMAALALDPYDRFMQAELIWNPKYGLVSDYPWITKGWVDEQVKDIKRDWLVAGRLYYSVFDIVFDRTNIRQADGSEVENAMIWINGNLFSQNVMLAKLLELKAKEEDLERYVNQLLGIPKYLMPKTAEEIEIDFERAKADLRTKQEKLKKLRAEERAVPTKEEKLRKRIEIKKAEEEITKAKEDLKKLEEEIAVRRPRRMFYLPTWLFRRGPYESALEERISKYYMTPIGEMRYAPIVSFIKERFAIGR